MKRQIFMAVLLVLCLVLPSYAERHNPTGGTMLVTMEIEESYQQVIPADLPIEYGIECAELPVEISELHLCSGYGLYVTVQTTGALADTEDEQNQILFTVTDATDGETAALVFDDIGVQKLYICFTPEEWENAVSGASYEGLITFEFQIAEYAPEDAGEGGSGV